jgi:AcrR family transcriptional regulator
MGNREDTTERILEAGLALLAEEGFAGLGVNVLARRSGADKQLIYRYFGGMEGLLAALGRRVAGRLTAGLGAARAASYADLVEALLLALLRHLRADAQYRQLRMMEVAAPSAATAAFAAARGEVMAAWVQGAVAGLAVPQGVDVAAVNAMLIGAVEGVAILGAAGLTGDVEGRQEAALHVLVRAVYAEAGVRGG